MTRGEAIEELSWYFEYDDGTASDFVTKTAYTLAIKALMQPERKKGKWRQNDNGTWTCSLCQSWIPNEQHYYARYCLYCGAEMEEES